MPADHAPSPTTITVHTDHGACTLPAGSTVADLLARLEASQPALSKAATAVNGEFVPRGARASRVLAEGDTLLCFTAITGG